VSCPGDNLHKSRKSSLGLTRHDTRSWASRGVWWALLLALFLTQTGFAQPARRNYQPGDWVSFIEQRHVTGLTLGYDILYFATPFGVGRYHTVARRYLPPLTASSGLDDPEILQIGYDEQDGTLWVNTPLGSASFVEVFNEWRSAFEFPRRLLRDDVRLLNYATLFTPWGLSYHARGTGAPYGMFVDEGLRSYPITTALRDVINSDRIYLGTWGLGSGEIDALGERVTFDSWGLAQHTVQAIFPVGDDWFFAGHGAETDPPEISIFHTVDSTWSYLEPYYDVAAKGDITSINALGDMIFFGTPDGLLRYDQKKKHWRTYSAFDGLPDAHITALLPLGDLLWVGTARGPGILDPLADTGTIAISLAQGDMNSAWVYALDSAYGFVWAGTNRGLYRVHPDHGDWGRVVTGDGLLKGRVRDIAIRPEGIWCATDAGLVLIDSTMRSREVYRSRVELSDGDLYSLAVDGHSIWASSRSGVWRFNRQKSSWRLYTREDGLLDEFVYDIYLDGDHVWFAMAGGVSRFLWNSPVRID
jgi:ligand-binding sensor domain-containing protein